MIFCIFACRPRWWLSTKYEEEEVFKSSFRKIKILDLHMRTLNRYYYFFVVAVKLLNLKRIHMYV